MLWAFVLNSEIDRDYQEGGELGNAEGILVDAPTLDEAIQMYLAYDKVLEEEDLIMMLEGGDMIVFRVNNVLQL